MDIGITNDMSQRVGVAIGGQVHVTDRISCNLKASVGELAFTSTTCRCSAQDGDGDGESGDVGADKPGEACRRSWS